MAENQINFEKLYQEALEKFKTLKTDEPIYLCRFDEVPIDLLDKIGKIGINEEKVYIRANVTAVHYNASRAIARCLLSSSEKLKNQKYYTIFEYQVPFYYKYSNGEILKKRADFGLLDEKKELVIPGEVSFTNESLVNLINECVHYLTEYFPFKYSIGLKIFSKSSAFKAIFLCWKE